MGGVYVGFDVQVQSIDGLCTPPRTASAFCRKTREPIVAVPVKCHTGIDSNTDDAARLDITPAPHAQISETEVLAIKHPTPGIHAQRFSDTLWGLKIFLLRSMHSLPSLDAKTQKPCQMPKNPIAHNHKKLF